MTKLPQAFKKKKKILFILTEKTNGGLTLQVFETSEGWIANFKTLRLKLKNH